MLFRSVPYTRGAEYSRPLAEVLREAERLVALGARELTLLGQNVNAYHGERADGGRCTLGELVRKIADRLCVTARVKQLAPQPGDVDRTWADMSRARHELNWRPEIDIDRGLGLFLDWFARNRLERSS